MDVHGAVKVRTGNPPTKGGLNDTTICAFPRVTVGWAGALGAVRAYAGTAESASNRQPQASAAAARAPRYQPPAWRTRPTLNRSPSQKTVNLVGVPNATRFTPNGASDCSAGAES